jgi:DNA invertase Pin-like site-specific DNA recombinase
MTPPKGLRAILYLRQSTYREESISLELQEHEGRTYAQRNGYQVVAVEADPGISGRTWKRPAVQRVMDMIESHQADVIVLWKWSRLSRSRLDWAVAADRVESAGGRIESATEPIDTSTSTGRFARGMLTEFAAFESERIGDVWRESHSRRIRNGLPANGKQRFGYIYERGKGFTPHPLESPVLGETFRRYIGGESVYSLIQWLNDGPTRPASGYGVKTDGLWSDRTLRRVMDSGFAAGLINSHGELIPGAHEPIITGEEWDAYREARQRRRKYRRTERSEYVFSGLVWCVCGSKMHAGQFGAQRTPKYRCKDAHEKRTHAGGYVSQTVVEQAVLDHLETVAGELNKRITEGATQPRPRKQSSTLHIDRQLALLAGKMDTLAEKLINPGIPHDTYIRMRDRYETERQALETQRLSITVEESFTPAAIIPDLLGNWDLMTVPEKREILRALITRITVTPGHPKATIEITPK